MEDNPQSGSQTHHAHAKLPFLNKLALLTESGRAGKAGHDELFFDLIFVASMYRLGGILFDTYQLTANADEMWIIVAEVFIVFAVLWLTWNHLNLLRTRFRMQGVWMLAQFSIFICTVCLAISMAEAGHTAAAAADDDGAHRMRRGGEAGIEVDEELLSHASSLTSPAFSHAHFALFWTLSRVIYLTIYVCGMVWVPSAKKFCSVYAGSFVISIIFTLSITILSWDETKPMDRATALGLALTAIFFELFSSVLPVLVLKPTDRPPIDVEHQIERSELWCILIMGESMLSIITSVVPQANMSEAEGTYIIGAFSFIIIFVMMEIYIFAQPHFGAGLDTHAQDLELSRAVVHSLCQLPLTFSLFCLGVGLKACLKFGHENSTYNAEAGTWMEFRERNSWMVTMSAAFALFWITASNYAHEWANFKIGGYSWLTRRVMRSLLFIVSGVLLPLALMISTEEVTTDECLARRARRGGDGVIDASAADDCVARRDRRGGAPAGPLLESTGNTVVAFLTCVLVLLAVCLLIQVLSQPSAAIWDDLTAFQNAQEKMAADEGEDKEKAKRQSSIGEDKLSAASVAAFAEEAQKGLHQGDIRTGGKALRFSDSKMAAAIKKNKAANNGRMGTKSLFAAFQKIVDTEDPNNSLSSEEVRRRKAWRKGASLSVALKGSGRGSMAGLGAAMTKRGSIHRSNKADDAGKLPAGSFKDSPGNVSGSVDEVKEVKEVGAGAGGATASAVSGFGSALKKTSSVAKVHVAPVEPVTEAGLNDESPVEPVTEAGLNDESSV